MKFTVCIPTLRPTTLSHTVRSILAQTWPEWELLIVGQGDDPDLSRVGAQMQALDGRIRYLHLNERGLSRARNAGLAAATGDIIAMTDDDCEAAPGWLATLAALFAEHPEVGVIGGALLAPPVLRWKLESCLNFIPDAIIYNPASEQAPPPAWSWIGGNFAVRKRVVERVGYFDVYLGAGAPDFPAAEDIDYNMRILAAGIGVLCSPAVIVHHTYGVRRGLRQNLRTSWAYAQGNAGLDAKLTLAGDPHGQESASRLLWQSLGASLRRLKVYRLPLDIAYALTYRAAYQKCLRDFTLAPDGRLTPRSGATEGAALARASSEAR